MAQIDRYGGKEPAGMNGKPDLARECPDKNGILKPTMVGAG